MGRFRIKKILDFFRDLKHAMARDFSGNQMTVSKQQGRVKIILECSEEMAERILKSREPSFLDRMKETK